MFDLTTFDYIYVGVVLTSTIWATIRGGVYETVATVSWIIAALASKFISPYLNEIFQGWFNLSEPTIGTLVSSYFIVFFVILVLFSFINQRLRDRVQESMLKITDHTLGVVFGIIRGIVLMGAVYWAALWYFSDTSLPAYVTSARTRPVMQLTAVKLDEWFIPGESKLLERDMKSAAAAKEIYDNLINPRVQKESSATDNAGTGTVADTNPADVTESSLPAIGAEDTGYKNSERSALENQLLQIESSAVTDE